MSGKATEKPSEGKSGNGRLMSIREVSAFTGVPPHTLRFWEKQMPDILRPDRTRGGQRRYDSAAVERVRTIKRLADEKRYSLAAIRNRLAAAHSIVEPARGVGRRIGAEQAVDLIINEVASLLRDRLLNLFEAGEPARAEKPDRNPAELQLSSSEGGNSFGLERKIE